MFDFLNPALREGKRRAKEEYRQRMLQGKIDEAMRHAREDADRKLAFREKLHKDFRAFSFIKVLMYAAVIVVVVGMFAH